MSINYDFEDDSRVSDTEDDLTNLSRQSMVPLNELIAYYQYIQHGYNQDASSRGAVSRSSSSSSQQVDNKIKYQSEISTIDEVTKQDDVDGFHDNDNSNEEPVVSKISIPRIHVGSDDKIIPTSSPNSDSETNLPIKDKRRIRANVVLELINSERDFVKHLRDVVEGYLYPARKHPEIFTFDRIKTIFANIEQLYDFQRKFLGSLEECIDWDDPAASRVGNCFIKFEKGFSVYHYYCNNHPNASSELQELYCKPRFVKFFEACRVLQNMIDISLDGFLLTPIQKICKYPLQLNELLKNTDETHPDFGPVADALESMRNCANVANERKRRIEALADVMSFQERVENWQGPHLKDTSSILIHSGEVSKITSQTWSQGIHLHLFDHLLLLSKKDLLKRNTLIYKGRICMDTVTEISDADEYKPKKSFKLYCSDQKKWFIFTARSEKDRDDWIRAFERERNLVDADESEGFHITEKEIGVAKRTLQSRKHCRSARYRLRRPDTAIVDHLDIDDAITIMNRTLSLPSCIHPSHVMNFVEDLKVVTDRKRVPSPSSPTPGNQQPTDQENMSTGNWFKKMGSKKLTRNQVYNINNGKPTTSNSPIGAGSTTSPTSNKYDELEKKHRVHMVSEEQARLYRLNNDMPSYASNKSPLNQRFSGRNSFSIENDRKPVPNRRQTIPDPSDLNLNSIKLSSPDQKSPPKSTDQSERPDKSVPNQKDTSFEATIVLSSGRVVRVREDSV